MFQLIAAGPGRSSDWRVISWEILPGVHFIGVVPVSFGTIETAGWSINVVVTMPNVKKRKILLVLCGGDPCCDRLDLRFDDLNSAGRVNGLYCLEEIP